MTQGQLQLSAVMFFIFLLLAHSFITRHVFSLKDSSAVTGRSSLIAFITGLTVIVFTCIATLVVFDVCCKKNEDFFEGVAIFASIISEDMHGFISIRAYAVCGISTLLLLICLTALYYCTHFSKDRLDAFVFYMTSVFYSGVMFVFVESAVAMFIAYEFLLIPTTLMIDGFAKTSRGVEAARFMLIWTQVGALTLFPLLIYSTGVAMGFNIVTCAHNFTQMQKNVIMFLAFFGFGAKMPVWPFYWWLPEAHVEVTTAFSIVLSGVSVKFAFLGFMRFVGIFGVSDLYWLFTLVALVGLCDAALKMGSESDIKKIVAYQTVAEMHLLIIFTLVDYSSFGSFVMYMFATHCWTATLLFILVDMISKRYNSRNIEHLYGIFAGSPRIVHFVYYTVFIGSSIPGTAIFGIEYFAASLSTATVFNSVFIILFHTLLVIYSKNIWWFVFGGDGLYTAQSRSFTFTRSEALFIFIIMLQLIPTVGIFDIVL